MRLIVGLLSFVMVSGKTNPGGWLLVMRQGIEPCPAACNLPLDTAPPRIRPESSPMEGRISLT